MTHWHRFLRNKSPGKDCTSRLLTMHAEGDTGVYAFKSMLYIRSVFKYLIHSLLLCAITFQIKYCHFSTF